MAGPAKLMQIGGRGDRSVGIFVHGFLAQSEDPTPYKPWADGLVGAGYRGVVRAYTWPSGGGLGLLGALVPGIAGISRIAWTSHLVAAALAGASFWKRVADSAEEHGALVADAAIDIAGGQPVDLFGHSLGAAVVLTAARQLASRGQPARSACVCGAAVERAEDWDSAVDAVVTALVNVYSTRDTVLMTAFRGGQVLSGRGAGSPAGRQALVEARAFGGRGGTRARLVDLDASAFVDSHFAYAEYLPAVLGPHSRSIWGEPLSGLQAEARAERRGARERMRNARKNRDLGDDW